MRAYSRMESGRNSVGWHRLVALLSGRVVSAGLGRSKLRRRKKPDLPPHDWNARPSASAFNSSGSDRQLAPSGTLARYLALLGQSFVNSGDVSSSPSSAARRASHL